MSLQSLRTLARPVASRPFATSTRLLSTHTDTKTPATTESNAGIVPDAPVRDIVTADVVSGAPRAYGHFGYYFHHLTEPVQVNCVIVP